MMKVSLIVLCLCLFSVPLIADAGSEPVSVQADDCTLYGTLEIPQGSGPFVAVLIIAGSGPTDRDGNSPLLPGSNDHLKLLAVGLAQKGIAALRYDKRGIAQSACEGLEEEDLAFDDLVDDAVLMIKLLKNDDRFSKVTVIGHSQGSLIGMLASKKADADGFVSIAGAGLPISDIILRQIEPQLPAEAFKEAKYIVEELKAGRTVADVNQMLVQLFRPSVQPFLSSYFRYDPREEIEKLDLPVLVIQGETDIQTSPADADMLAGANRNARKALVAGMNHVLKEAGADQESQMKAYTDPSLPLAPGLVEEIVRFIE
jgi:pimeloyl-ACP methyl ester carboxylesterase